jgi:hypothetical protein
MSAASKIAYRAGTVNRGTKKIAGSRRLHAEGRTDQVKA